MTAIEALSDRATKAPPSGTTMAKIADPAYAAGVLLRLSDPNIILSPPLVVTESDIANVLSALDARIAAA